MNAKVKVARLSILSNTLLIIMKLIVGLMSGSVSIMSEAIHSGIDLIAAIIAFLSVRISDKPSDDKHQYGHGKYENVSGVIEALLILFAAIWIIVEALKKLRSPEAIDSIGIGFTVMFISAAVNFFVSRKLYKVAKETDSVALEADALHLKTDVYTSLGVGIGLLLIRITGWDILDPLVAMMVALLIIKESWQLTRKAFNPLLDSAWEKDDLDNLKNILASNNVAYHDLKTRKSGNYKFVEFHFNMPPDKTLGYVHDQCDRIEKILMKEFSYLSVTIHPEPLE